MCNKIINNANILAIIPARGGSKGIPKKNIKPFVGKPLIYYAIKLAKEAKKSGLIVDHLVSTDSREIKLIAEKWGGRAPFLRPKELAADKSPMVDTIIHALNWWEKKNRDRIHSVLLLQPTHPLTTLKDIENAIEHYLNNQTKEKCLISICDAQHIRLPTLYYKKGKYLEQAIKGLNPNTQRQAMRSLYWRNGGIYLTRRDLLLRKRMLVNERPLFYEVSKFYSADLDDIFDWVMAEFLLNYNITKRQNV